MASKTKGASPIFLDEEIDEKNSNVVYIRNRRRRIAFGWYGGKFSHLDWLLPLLPTCHHYCEPFSGSGAVLLNRESSPVETYNDIDGEVVNFFRVLRDGHEELIRAIALTPFSREEYHQAIYGSTSGISDAERARMASLLGALQRSEGALPLSSEAIVTLIKQHLACKNASRLPVLVVAAAYEIAGTRLAENLLPLNAHNAADMQTGSLGDVEICLVGDDSVATAYEMKMKRITQEDIDVAVTKIARASKQIHNYLFITTDTVDPGVAEYAATFYEKTGGTEIAILDCVGFLRHFLHLFHRIRSAYLNAYQALLLNEPDSAVSQTLKEAFLALRQAAESDE